MAINLVRKPSETPNISNYDDYRMFRYATGGYNGVIEKYGNECDYEINGNTFKIKSGEIVIDGVQSKIDSVGVELTVDNVTGTEYYTVYCEVNLSLINNQKTEIKATKNTVNYPVIEKGDDLTEVQTGIARLELYRFTASSGVISNVTQRFSLVEVGTVKNAINAENAEMSEKAKNAILNNDGSYSGFTQNVNNVLKVGDEIVKKKKIIFNIQTNCTGYSNPVILTLTEMISVGDEIEIQYSTRIDNTLNCISNAIISETEGTVSSCKVNSCVECRYGTTPGDTKIEISTLYIKYTSINSAQLKFYGQNLTFISSTGTYCANGGATILKIYKIIE